MMEENPTFDFFSLHLSQALQTRLRALTSDESMECLDGDDMFSAIMTPQKNQGIGHNIR